MKKLLMVLLISVFMTSGCHWHRIHGNGSMKSEPRDVAAFEAISCDGSYEVQVDCQAKQSLEIETDENLLPLVKTEVRNHTLRIYTKGMLDPTGKIRVAVSVPNIEEFRSSGSTQGEINNVNNSELSIEINGSGKLQLNGKSGKVDINTSGSSKIDAASLISEDANIHINGSGNIQVYAMNSISVQINGSGKVKYKGEPKSVNQQINGSGSVVKE